jgi:hypothetical protein
MAKCDGPQGFNRIGSAEYGHIRDWGEIQANASLIAAAPEMKMGLDMALKALRSYQFGNSSTDLAEEVTNYLELVIAKAEGK